MRAEDEALIVACIPSLRRYARGLAGNAHQADDLVQDTLEKAWSRFSRWQRRGELRAWLFGIMHNHFIDGLRTVARHGETVSDTVYAFTASAERFDTLEIRDLDRCLRALPTEQREILLLVCVEELPYEQVAKVLGVPVGTVMSRLSRARARLSALMQGTPAPAQIHRIQ